MTALARASRLYLDSPAGCVSAGVAALARHLLGRAAIGRAVEVFCSRGKARAPAALFEHLVWHFLEVGD